MTKREKRLRKLCNNPNDASFKDMKHMLNSYGFEIERINGSHFIFKNKGGERIVIITHCGKVKKWYVKEAILVIKKLNKIQDEL